MEGCHWNVKINGLPVFGNDPEESELNRLSRKLGYLLRLIDATFPIAVKAGEDFTISAKLSNDGYAGIIKSRPVFLYLIMAQIATILHSTISMSYPGKWKYPIVNPKYITPVGYCSWQI